mgnify:CR=1 FL=1
MTTTEFLNLHLIGGGNDINFGRWMNVLYNPIGSTSVGKIEAITITQECLTFNGLTTLTEVNITDVLNQCETITFTFNNQQYVFTITSRALYAGSAGGTTGFYYFEGSTPSNVPDTLAGALGNPEYNITVGFEPFLGLLEFSSSDYNVLYNNGQTSRKSSIILESDRREGFSKPSNFEAILSTSASKASVQDSSYSDTGLINGRYNGRKSEQENYAGVKPALSAREYKGEIHPGDADLDVACGLSIGERLINNILHTGPNTLPGFTSSSLFIKNNSTVAPVDTQFIYDLYGSFNELVAIGDVIKTDGDNVELMRVTSFNSYNQVLGVQRGYMGTTAVQIPSDTPLFKLNRTDNYRIDEFDSNLTAINNSIIYVVESNSLLHTDDFGQVFKASTCPDIINAFFGTAEGG